MNTTKVIIRSAWVKSHPSCCCCCDNPQLISYVQLSRWKKSATTARLSHKPCTVSRIAVVWQLNNHPPSTGRWLNELASRKNFFLWSVWQHSRQSSSASLPHPVPSVSLVDLLIKVTSERSTWRNQFEPSSSSCLPILRNSQYRDSTNNDIFLRVMFFRLH